MLKELAVICMLAALNFVAKSDRQGDALYDMKNKLNANADQLSDWNINQVNPCTWSSIQCDSNNNVNQVSLSCMGFNGTLSPRIGELQYLTFLSLSDNAITGGIPTEFGNLSSLQSLDLENNHLSGQIPTSLSKLSKLQNLILSQNNLSGEIPASFSNLMALNDIRLAFNGLSGQIPDELFQIARYNFTGNNLNCGTNFSHPCSSVMPTPGSSHSSRIGIVLGSTGGAIGFLIVGIFFLLYKAKRKGYQQEVYVDVAGTHVKALITHWI